MAKDELQTLPGIGPSLKRRDPERLYARLNRLRGRRQDPCVLYAFRCAAYSARTPRPRAALLKWWNWKDRAVRAT